MAAFSLSLEAKKCQAFSLRSVRQFVEQRPCISGFELIGVPHSGGFHLLLITGEPFPVFFRVAKRTGVFVGDAARCQGLRQARFAESSFSR